MAQTKKRPAYPAGADRDLLRRFQRQSMGALERQFKEEHAAFLRASEMKAQALAPLVGRLGVTRKEVTNLVAERRARMQKLLRRVKPPAARALSGHNPARYAPFDFPWSAMNCGGITYCNSYGPNSGSGRIGSSLGVFNGGGASSGSAVGFWYYARERGTLFVTASALTWGRGYVFSALFGYASAYAGLRVYVQRYSPFTQWSAETTLYDNWGVLEFDIRSIDWETRTVSIAVPVVPNNWYAIWGDVHQSAYAGGLADSVSNYMLYVGPISHFQV